MNNTINSKILKIKKTADFFVLNQKVVMKRVGFKRKNQRFFYEYGVLCVELHLPESSLCLQVWGPHPEGPVHKSEAQKRKLHMREIRRRQLLPRG